VTLTAGSVARVALLVPAAVVLQLAVVSQIEVLDANPDLTPLVVVSVGLLGGPIAGSIVGFSIGLVIDMALVQTLGVTSLLMTTIGYLAGRYRDLRDTSHGLVPLVAGALATLAYAASFSVVQFLLGVDAPVSALVVRDILLQALLNAFLAIPLFAAVRALLRPGLVDVYEPRRRPSPTGLRVTTH
jgi:rod shape-determining protein MreD